MINLNSYLGPLSAIIEQGIVKYNTVEGVKSYFKGKSPGEVIFYSWASDHATQQMEAKLATPQELLT